MFSQEEFSKNHFIEKKIPFEVRSTNKENVIHIAFNIDDKFFMQMGVTVISILENNKDKYFSFHIFAMALVMIILQRLSS